MAALFCALVSGGGLGLVSAMFAFGINQALKIDVDTTIAGDTLSTSNSQSMLARLTSGSPTTSLKIDESYVEQFNKTYIDHLKSKDEMENQPQRMIQDALNGCRGKLSRVFDALKIPVSADLAIAHWQEHGEINTYMEAILKQLKVFNKTQTGLHLAISGIGKKNYARLIGANK